MDARTTAIVSLGVALIGIGGALSFDGAASGLSLLLAGVVIVALALWGRSTSAGMRTSGPEMSEAAEAPEPYQAEEEPAAEAEIQTEPEPGLEPEPAMEPEPEGSAEPAYEGPETTMVMEPAPLEPVYEPAPMPTISEPEPERAGVATAAEPGGMQRPDHEHDTPLLGHSELVSHLRDIHEGIPHDGSTIQLRLLHERSHTE